MKQLIYKFLYNLYHSFTNKKGIGMSARKLSAFAGVVIGYYETTKIESDVYRFYAVCVWLLFVLVCLGLVTFEQILKLKTEKYEKFNTDKPGDNSSPE